MSSSKLDPARIAVRALVTFFQVGISVLIGSGAFTLNADVAQVAAMSGIGAALSVIYNALTQWLATSDGGEDGPPTSGTI